MTHASQNIQPSAGDLDLSIVIPAYNEAHKIARDIEAAGRFLIEQGLRGEIIVADDGSADGTADTAQAAATPAGVVLRVLRLKHRGKGWAVRQGMMATRGQYAMFADSGLCVPFEDALPALQLLREGRCDLATGSRKLPQSVIEQPQSLGRRILSWLFRRTVLWFLGLPRDLTDTQCGFKVYRGDVARELFGQSKIDGFLFDLEILLRARRAGYVAREFPVHWACDRDSRLRPARLALRVFRELREVKHVTQEPSGGARP